MKKRLGPFARARANKLSDPIEITLDPAVPEGYVDNDTYPEILLASAVSKNLLFNIPAFFPAPDPGEGEVYRLDSYWDDTENFNNSAYIGSISLDDVGPYETEVKLAKLTHGRHHYSYKVTDHTGDNVFGSERVWVRVDRHGPYREPESTPPALTLPPGHVGPLVASDFEPDGTVDLGITDYDAHGASDGDTWQLVDKDGHVVAEGDVFPDQVVKLPLAQAELWEGAADIRHYLVDVSGNRSPISHPLKVTIALQPSPVLSSPGVKHALTLAGSGDRLIHSEDAEAESGMKIIIPHYDGDKSMDNAYVRMSTLHASNLQRGPISVGSNTLPFDFAVDYPTLNTLYGDSTGAIALTITYGVERGGIFHWLPVANQVTIELFLFKVGPPNPGEPDPVNINLPLAILTGAGSGLTNALDPSDILLDASVIVPYWTVAPLPSAVPYTVVLFYGNEEVDRVDVDNTNLPPGGIPMTVGWPYIAKHGNSTISNDIPLRYEIISTTTPNRNLSPTQPIVVTANVISFLPPSVDGSSTSPTTGRVTVGCNSAPGPSHDIVISVPPHQEFQVGMIIRVIWNAYSDDAGMMLISGASGTFDHTPLNGTEIVTGFKLRISPSTTYLKPIHNTSVSAGSVRVRYAVPILGSTPVDSAELHARVRAVLSGSTPRFCDGNPWP